MSIRNALFIIFIFFAVDSFVYANNQVTDSTIVPPIYVSQKNSSSLTQTAGPNNTITSAQVAITGATTLTQALSQIGGIQLRDILGNGSSVQISMRGFGSNASSNSLLLIDGIPITNPDLAAPDLNIIPLNAITSINIMMGSESVLYGDQAVGGVINIVTEIDDKNKVALSCSAGSFNTYQCYLARQNHIGAGVYNLSVFHKQSDNYRQHNAYEQNTILGLWNVKYGNDSLRLTAQFANEWMQYPGALTFTQVLAKRRQSTNVTDYFRNTNDFLHLQYIKQLTDNWRMTTHLTQRGMNGNGVLYSPFTQERNSYFLKSQLSGKLDHVSIINGLDFQADRYSLSSAYGVTRESQQAFSLFGLATIPIRSQTNLIVGMRGAQQQSQLVTTTKNNDINRAFASTIGLSYQPYDNRTFYLRRAESFRFPKADENAFTSTGEPLRTQRGAAYETGIDFKAPAYSLKLNAYQLDLRDEIAFDPLQTPAQPFGSNQNLSPTRRQGFMLQLNRSITSYFSVGGQYDYVNARFQQGVYAENRIPLVSENRLNAHLMYFFTDTFNLYAEALFTGNQYADNDNANVTTKMGGYTLFNANLRYRFKAFTALLQMNNIFNKAYYLYTIYQPSMATQYFYPAAEQNVMLTLRYSIE